MTVRSPAGAGRPVRVAVLPAADLGRDGLRRVTVAGRDLVVATSGGQVFACDADCSHAAGPLADGELLAGCVLECPWHGARFDLRSGAVERGPARKALRIYPTEIVDGTVVVTLP